MIAFWVRFPMSVLCWIIYAILHILSNEHYFTFYIINFFFCMALLCVRAFLSIFDAWLVMKISSLINTLLFPRGWSWTQHYLLFISLHAISISYSATTSKYDCPISTNYSYIVCLQTGTFRMHELVQQESLLINSKDTTITQDR